MFNCRHRKLSR